MPNLLDASLLLGRIILSFILLLLPPVAVSFAAARRRVYDTVQLGALGLAATAITGYCVFWTWFLSWRLVRPLGFALEAAALCYICYIVLGSKESDREGRIALQPLLAPAALVFTSALLILGATYAYGGLNTPFVPATARFSHQLPGDCALPYLFANSMMKAHKIPIPLQGDWLSSDRPPLQTAIVLGQYFALIWPRDISYQVLAVLLQSLWSFALWLLLYATRVHRNAIRLVLAGCLFSNFIFVNSAFVWPKLLAASYLLGFLALLLSDRLKEHPQTGATMAIVAGCLLAWSLLSHGGTAFAFFGLVPFIVLPGRFVSVKVGLITLLTVSTLYFPWMLYQKFVDPPGNRLVKMHVAGVWPIDQRPALQTILDSYHALPLNRIIEYKKRNLNMIFDTFRFWPTVREFLFQLPKLEPARSQVRLSTAKSINATQFFYFPSTLGFYILGIPLLFLGVIPRRRSPEWKLAVLLLLFTVVTDIIWAIIMFGPDTTVIHAGAYATILAAFTSGILGIWTLSRRLTAAVAALQISLFAYIHAFLLIPYNATLQFGMAAVVVLAFAGTLYLLLRVDSQEPGKGKLS